MMQHWAHSHCTRMFKFFTSNESNNGFGLPSNHGGKDYRMPALLAWISLFLMQHSGVAAIKNNSCLCQVTESKILFNDFGEMLLLIYPEKNSLNLLTTSKSTWLPTTTATLKAFGASSFSLKAIFSSSGAANAGVGFHTSTPQMPSSRHLEV